MDIYTLTISMRRHLALIPDAVVRTDRRAAALLAPVLPFGVRADARAAALLAEVPNPPMRTDRLARTNASS